MLVDILKFFGVWIVTWFAGVWGWSQIVGSIQNIKARKSLWFTLVLWVVILAAIAYVALFVVYELLGLLFGYGISLIMVLRSGKIE